MHDKKIPIELTDDEFLKIAKMAHENDITFNHMCERILTEALLDALHPETQKKQSVRRRASRPVSRVASPARKRAGR